MNEDIPFPILNQIPVEFQKKVSKILQLKMSIDERLERLEDYMTVSQLRECRKWMEKKAGDFLCLLTDSDQEFVEDYFEKKDIPLLDAVVKNYDENTQNVYEMWKKLSGFEIKEENEEKSSRPKDDKKKKTKQTLETDSEEELDQVKTKKGGKKKKIVKEEDESEDDSDEEPVEEEKPKKTTKKHKKTK